MTRLRLWIGIVATMGVLLHAGFLVRHSLTMADATRHYHAILADLGSLCRASAGEEGIAASDQPQVPRPTDTTGCPICAGLVGGIALAGPQPAALPVPTAGAAATQFFNVDVAEARPLRAAHPPARGPPSLA